MNGGLGGGSSQPPLNLPQKKVINVIRDYLTAKVFGLIMVSHVDTSGDNQNLVR